MKTEVTQTRSIQKIDELQEEKKFAAERFGISENEVAWYHSGTCYDRVAVTTQEAADKVTKKVNGQTVNGGFLHGMPLGAQSKNESGTIEIYC